MDSVVDGSGAVKRNGQEERGAFHTIYDLQQKVWHAQTTPRGKLVLTALVFQSMSWPYHTEAASRQQHDRRLNCRRRARPRAEALGSPIRSGYHKRFALETGGKLWQNVGRLTHEAQAKRPGLQNKKNTTAG